MSSPGHEDSSQPPAVDAWTSAPPSEMEKAFYGEGTSVITPESYDELKDVVRFAEERRQPIVPSGLGTRAYLGNPPPRQPLVVSLRRLAGVLRYQPDDFTVGVQAGLPLSELRECLSENSQEVGLDVPGKAAGTVGGAVAAQQPGPRLRSLGAARASIIGVCALRGGPSLYKGGGMVVKNVAGYEVAKLLAGSMGTAGFLLEVNFKLRPLPETRATRCAGFESSAAAFAFVRELRSRNLAPLTLSVLAGGGPAALGALLSAEIGASHYAVVWSFEGNSGAVDWQQREVERLLERQGAGGKGGVEIAPTFSEEDADGAYDFLCGVADPGLEPRDDLAILRLGVLPAAIEALVARMLAIFSRADSETKTPTIVVDALSGLATARWEGSPQTVDWPLRAMTSLAEKSEGTGVLLYLPPALRGRWTYLLTAARNVRLTRNILRVFDPAGIFCPGRVHPLPAEGRDPIE